MITARKHIMFIAILAVWWEGQGQLAPLFDMIIAQDGSGDFTTITQGISSAPSFCSSRFRIKLCAGIYNENIVINKEKTNLTIIGEGMERGIITGSRSYGDGMETFETATVVALLTKASYLAFYKCRIIVFQDTLYAERGCRVPRVLHIRSEATRWAIKHSDWPRTRSFRGTRWLRDPQLHNWCNFGTYLGRPWRDCARTIVMQSYLDDCIDPRGWLEFDSRSSDLDLSYAEYDNRGPGSATYGRVKWKGYRVIHSLEAYQFTVREFIYGDWWIPATGVVIL
ncbi:hypothetical protein J1N35_020934 [Gossypium stocksii]|uniref:Pectinesterase catalytic domain-containing protein n=1 Tax=Gossypium stocksii TaxID=47602 RepID=A0A9D4A0V0_9ROSI|nr:hypothetical protein J1N35_020934 [Gossypium stocksii]